MKVIFYAVAGPVYQRQVFLSPATDLCIEFFPIRMVDGENQHRSVNSSAMFPKTLTGS